MIRKIVRSLLPEYSAQSLTPPKRWLVSLWLKYDPEARSELLQLQHLWEAVQAQPLVTPSSDVWKRIQARTRTSGAVPAPVPVPRNKAFWPAWIGGMTLILLSFVLLWYVFPPGVVLQWTTHTGEPSVFRIYRAPSGEQFELLDEIPVGTSVTSLGARMYTYRDFLLLPGQEYVYLVEMEDDNGQTVSQTIMSSATEALPGQIALLAAFCLVIYGLSLALPKPRVLPLQLIK